MPTDDQISKMAQEFLRRQGYSITPPRKPTDPQRRNIAMPDGVVFEVTLTAAGEPTMVVKRKIVWTQGRKQTEFVERAIAMAKQGAANENNGS